MSTFDYFWVLNINRIHHSCLLILKNLGEGMETESFSVLFKNVEAKGGLPITFLKEHCGAQIAKKVSSFALKVSKKHEKIVM